MMGYRQIRDKLQLEFGLIVSDPSVWKSMKRLGIHGYTRRRKEPATQGLEHIRYSNVLNRKFKAEKPMEKIVTDVTYIKHNGKWYYLAGCLDLFNNEIVEWELSDTFDNFLVMNPVERLLKRKMSTEHQVLLHSDQGVQYSSAGYCNLLKEYNVIQSMSRAGNPRGVSKCAVKRNQRERRGFERPGYGNGSDVFGVQSGCRHGQKQSGQLGDFPAF